jgi:hypothetical protein
MFNRMQSPRRMQPRATRWLPALACAVLLASCSNLSFQRDTATSGRFTSSGFAVTLLSFDLPKGALMIARENASDANIANMVVEESTVFPYLGALDWLLDIIGVRWAKVTGTWGVAPKPGAE